MPLNFACKVSLSYSYGSLTCRKILRHGTAGFTFPRKEVVLRIFIAFKNPSSSVGLEPAVSVRLRYFTLGWVGLVRLGYSR
jgi:hypothetical protein